MLVDLKAFTGPEDCFISSLVAALWDGRLAGSSWDVCKEVLTRRYAVFISSCYNAVKKKGNVKRKGRVGEFTDVIAVTSSLPGQYSDVFVVCMHQTCPAVPSQAAAAWAETPGVA